MQQLMEPSKRRWGESSSKMSRNVDMGMVVVGWGIAAGLVAESSCEKSESSANDHLH